MSRERRVGSPSELRTVKYIHIAAGIVTVIIK